MATDSGYATNEQAEDTLISSMKVPQALLELHLSTVREYNSTRNKKLVKHILKHLENDYKSSQTLSDMADFALTRGDLALWNQVILLSVTNYANVLFEDKTSILRACQVFGFNNVRSSLDQMFHALDLYKVVDFVRTASSVPRLEDAAVMDEWLKEHIRIAVNAMSYWDAQHLDIASEIVQNYGIRCFLNIRCKIKTEGPMKFARAFVLFLQDHRDDILSSPVNRLALNHGLEAHSEEIQAAIDRIIYRLMTAASDYVISNLQDSTDRYGYRRQDFCGAYVQSVTPFLQLCFDTGKVEMCQSVLDAVLEAPGNETNKLHNLLIPIVRDLCPLLRKFKSPVYSPPFAHFLRQVIEYYSRLLGSRTHNPQLDLLLRIIRERFYCTCDDCVQLTAFMKQLYVRQKTFLVSRRGHRHFHRQIWASHGLARIEAVNSPHGFCIKVIKTDKPIGEQRWEARIKAFKEFLALIGDEEVIAKVMKERYIELTEIMEGYSSFPH